MTIKALVNKHSVMVKRATSDLTPAAPKDGSRPCGPVFEEKIGSSVHQASEMKATLPDGPSRGEWLFRPDMTERDVKVSFLMLEDQAAFETWDFKSKVQGILCNSSIELRRKYYEWKMDSGDTLPETYEAMKVAYTNIISQRALESLKRYVDESVGDYLQRLVDFAQKHRFSDATVRLHLMRSPMSREIRLLISSKEGISSSLIASIREFEEFAALDTKPTFRGLTKCQFCGKVGHSADKCSSRFPKKQPVLHIECMEDEDESKKNVSINDKSYSVLFDTGSKSNFITYPALKTVGRNIDIIKIPRRTFLWINGAELISERQVKLNIVYRNIKSKQCFFVVESTRKVIILGRDFIKQASNVATEKADILGVNCYINTAPGEFVSWTRPIRNREEKEKFLELVNDLESRKIIEPSKSMWLNPVVLIKKKTGDIRFCVDFRRLNELVRLDEYRVPKIQEIIATLGGMSVFSLIDIKDGFFHIPIADEHKHKTAFLAGDRLMQFRMMPQGFKNSPAIFQRAMERILEGLVGKKCIVYIDDILVFGSDKKEHDDNFIEILGRLEKYNFKENMNKRIHGVAEVNFLGYRISKNCIKPALNRSQGISDYARPATQKELRRFIGIVNYDRHFVKSLSEIAKPLFGLLEKGVPFIWGDIHEKAFNEIKGKWSTDLNLRIPDLNTEFTIESDASDTGIGAVLRQGNCTIAYISRTLSSPERNYTITEREVLAALWAMEKFEYYIGGQSFTIVTDHKAIEAIRSKSEFGTPRIKRWFERLGRHNFKVIYRKGEELVASDALSRSTGAESINIVEPSMTIMDIHLEQGHRKKIYNVCREKGIIATRREIAAVLETCERCARQDKIYCKSSGFIRTTRPGERVGLDILEVHRGFSVMVGIDYFTRKCFTKLLTNKKKCNAIQFIKEIAKKLPIEAIVADNGGEFKNKEFTEYLAAEGIRQIETIPYYHNTNGRVERLNRTLRRSIQRLTGTMLARVQNATKAYNGAFHRGIGMTPDQAGEPENAVSILGYQSGYASEFKKRSLITYEVGQKVLIRNEVKEKKSDDEFIDGGKITEVLEHGGYTVRDKKNRMLKKHFTQLRAEPNQEASY